jgi:4-amino-4-deoxy-L-arabinose transferase-like glycosyltransferase
MTEVRFGSLSAPRKLPALWSPLQQRQLERVLHAGLAREPDDDAGAVAPEPPLFYALEAIPYRLASGATLLDRIAFMRVWSAAMAGATALLVLLFVRELLPGRPWTWTVGGVGAAFVPMLGFVSGGVNPDALLFPVCAALFLGLARAFRRGLTTRRAVGIGVVLGIGAITKINFYGLVPGALVAVVLAARVSEGAWNARVVRLVAATAAIGAAPYVLMLALDALLWDRTFILPRTPGAVDQDLGGWSAQLSYLWQVYLPRLPGQTPAFPQMSPTYALWVVGFIGRFGWMTVVYPGWAYRVGEGVLIAIALLALRALAVERATLRRRVPELAAYASMTAGMLLLLGMVALRGFAPGLLGAVQGRYLLPLLALFAALLVLAARGAGDRWGRAAGVTIVVLAIAWSVFGQLLTVAYYYS